MNNQQLINDLNLFRERLAGEVLSAFEQRGSSFGSERFSTWRRKFTQFLHDHIPGEIKMLNAKLSHFGFVILDGESDAQRFWREDGEKLVSYIDSLIIDIENDECNLSKIKEIEDKMNDKNNDQMMELNSVFIVHGHDGEAKERTARFIEKLGFEAIILHEQANRGLTIIEKIEKYSNVGFGIVLYTPDDLGNVKSEAEKQNGDLNPRARQNVILEHGYLMGKIGRENVIPLVAGNVELPNDISGMVYISDKDWKVDIAKEMKDAGYEIDFNKLL